MDKIEDNLKRMASKILDNMGDSILDVRDTIKSEGIRGRKDDPLHCPVSLYLSSKLVDKCPDILGSGVATVHNNMAILKTSKGNDISVPLPSEVACFVRLFDGGSYTELSVSN